MGSRCCKVCSEAPQHLASCIMSLPRPPDVANNTAAASAPRTDSRLSATATDSTTHRSFNDNATFRLHDSSAPQQTRAVSTHHTRL
ncbi:hypothetical protein Micbo1qcDRAFT_166817, partial [Microdochium bolleyi]